MTLLAHTRRRALNLTIRVVGLALLFAGFAVPVYAFWYATQPPVYGLAEQVSVPLPQRAAAVPISSYREGVLVLSYHDLTRQPHNEYTVTPRAFAAQMAALKQAGFHSIGAAEFAAFHAGAPVRLPSRPLLITFDDGAKGTWIYADRILARLGFEATVFLITGDVSHHQPYYLDWAEVEAMQATGRWSFGSHTDEGHGLIASNNSGDTGPFLTNRVWLPSRDRLETLGEYRARVTADLDRSIEQIRSHDLPRPELFAFPFSAAVEPTNDPVIGPLLARLLEARFSALLDNTTSATLITPKQRGPLPRVEVFRTTAAPGLLREAAATVRRSSDPSPEGGL
jgi:peptidoglycan/xylan/chitin deacetylase (PgdA/CDA1 family)